MTDGVTGIDITESVRDRMGALIPGFYENKRFSHEKYMKKPGRPPQRAQVIRSYNFNKCKRLLSCDRIDILMYFHWCRVLREHLT
jgi:hypothetical protein